MCRRAIVRASAFFSFSYGRTLSYYTMKLTFVPARPELREYVTKIWLFENNNGLINHGTLIAPNGRCKIIIPYKNSLTTTSVDRTRICREGDIVFIGIRDMPVRLGSPVGESGSIGIEFTTAGAYRFLPFPMSEIVNDLFSFSDLYGAHGNEILKKVREFQRSEQKLNAIQDFLYERLQTINRNNLIIDHSVNFISSNCGLSSIRELERRTGYTKRYLDILFKDHLGISPKTFSTIVRFQSFYKHLPEQGDSATNGRVSELYYDQSHFIKEFKRYTGHTPAKFSQLQNDFGKYF